MNTGTNRNDVELEQRALQPVLSTRQTIQIAALGETLDASMRQLQLFTQQQSIQIEGPPFVRYHTFGESETDVEIGVPVSAAVAGKGQVGSSELPGGAVITTWHLGSHDMLGEVYGRIQAWLAEHNRVPSGPSWEVYYWINVISYDENAAMADPSAWRTQLVQPIG